MVKYRNIECAITIGVNPGWQKSKHLEILQEWNDYQMIWNPDEYDGIKTFNIRPSEIWVPDIVLYNK